jgi:CHAT domain-containing protein
LSKGVRHFRLLTAWPLFLSLVSARFLSGQTAADDVAAGERLFRLDNYAKARPFWVDAENQFAVQGDKEKALYARVSRLRGDSETILSYPSVSQEIGNLLDDPSVQSNLDLRLRCLVVKGAADLSSKDPVTSGRVWTEALQVAEKLQDQFWIGRVSGELAVISFLKGDTAMAIKLNVRAFEIAQRLNDVQGEIRQKSLRGVGLLEEQRYDEALIRFDDALKLARTDPDVRFPLMAYMGKAQALEAQGNVQKSQALRREALEYVDGANMQVYKADLLLALAGQAVKQKDLKAGHALLEQAAEAAKKMQMPRPYAEANLRMTELYVAAGDFRRAEISVKEGVTASRQLVDMYFLPQHLALAAEIEGHLEKFRQADEYYEEAEQLVEGMLLNVPSAMVKASLISTMDSVFRGHFELALQKENQVPKALRIMERVRGRVVADNLRAQSQSAADTVVDSAANRELGRVQGKLLRTSNVAQRAGLAGQLQRAEERIDLTTLSQNRVRFSIHGNPVDLPSLQQHIADDEVLLEYVMDDPDSYCVAVTKTTVTHYRLEGRSAIEHSISEYLDDTKAMRQPESARVLYRYLFAPISEYRQKLRVIVVPDGKLGFIPFDALIDTDGKYAIQTHTLSYIPSATVLFLLRNTRRTEADNSLLAIGNSNAGGKQMAAFGSNARGLDFDKPVSQLDALPSVDDEIHQIVQTVGSGSQVLLGSEASEATFKNHRLGKYRVIHIAAHGFADLKFPDRSGLLLGFDTNNQEDGLLQVREIRDFRLRADLVTLSACDAGAGKLEGQNGVASIVQAFLFAGAQSVVASLWTADDVFTAALMGRFYRHLVAGASVGGALRLAKLEMIERFGSKAVALLWAGFFVTGDPQTSVSFK